MSSRATPARAHACRATGAIAVTAQRKAAGPSIRTAGQSPVGSALAVTQLGSWLIARGREPSLPQATGPMPSATRTSSTTCGNDTERVISRGRCGRPRR